MPPGPDLKHSVTPRYDLLDFDIYESMAIQSSRGCPFHCEFCDITLMFGRSVRTKTPQQVLKELDILYDLGWRKGILFVDDNFIGQPLSAKALLRELIPWMEERGHPFEFVHPSVCEPCRRFRNDGLDGPSGILQSFYGDRDNGS